MPTTLEVYVDGALGLTVAATYRKRKGYLLFDSRHICYHLPNKPKSCLEINYGTYTLDSPLVLDVGPTEKRVSARKVRQAESLAQKATAALKEGKIESAVRTLRNIAKNYSGTPQAVEAQKLLEGLPEGL